MVSFHNMGRCGNFLFQAATTIGYAKKHGLQFSMPCHTNNLEWNPLYLPHLINPAFNPKLSSMVIQEAQHHHYEIPYHEGLGGNNNNIFLEGYWQSYKYFDFCRQDILDLFNLPYDGTRGFVSIHVRRGDYLKYPDINPLATRDYYQQAVCYFVERGFDKFRVFSDDPTWCVEEFKHEIYRASGVPKFIFYHDNPVLKDLMGMAECQHNIISNSTFAWWGAYLNRNPGKIVICPHEDNYYGPANKHLDVSTLYPPEWIRIKY